MCALVSVKSIEVEVKEVWKKVLQTDKTDKQLKPDRQTHFGQSTGYLVLTQMALCMSTGPRVTRDWTHGGGSG